MSTKPSSCSILNFRLVRRHLARLTKNKLVAGSLVMFTGSMVANIGNYVYHLLMGRMLGPVDYGSLQSIISVGYLLFIALSALTLTTAKIVAGLKGKKNLQGVRWLFDYFNQNLIFYTGAVFLLISLLSPLIADFLHLDSVLPIIFIALLFLSSSFSVVYRAILQGLLRFDKIVKSHISETASKVLVAVLLVWAGWQVNGAVFALVAASLVGCFLAKAFLRPLKRYVPKKPTLSKRTFLKFGLPVFLFNLSFTSIYTNDVILVKHFFDAHTAGLYASLAILGKIVFFATSAIPMVMFPMVANRHSQGKDSRRLLAMSLAIVFLISSAAVTVYFLLPELMIKLLFGPDYLAAAPLLGWIGLFIAFYSLAYLSVSFFLSVDKVKVAFLAIAAALVQVVLISFFHRTLMGVIKISAGVCLLLLVSLMIYYFYGQKNGAFRYRSRL